MRYPTTINRAVYGLLIAGFIAVLPLQGCAHPGWRYPRYHRHRVVTLPAGYVHFDFGKHRYYYHRGVYYRHTGGEYVVVTAPVGARLRVLPPGYVSIRIGGRRYYHYCGTYYVYQPRDKVYVVVDPPGGSSALYDTIKLTDGTTLEGTYLGGTQRVVHFRAAGEVLEIPVKQVASISVAGSSD